MAASIRASRADDGPTLQTIEILAGERFREIGLAAVADDAPLPISTLTAYADAGRSWVAVDERDVPIGYALVDVVDGQAHLEQISVRPDEQGRGVGRALIGQVRYWAKGSGYSTLTLTTFTDVPWNGPLYEHLGFHALGADGIGPGLKQLQLDEADHGLDPTRRVAMALDLRTPFGRWPDADRSGDGTGRRSRRRYVLAGIVALSAVAVGLVVVHLRSPAPPGRKIESIRVGECFDRIDSPAPATRVLVVPCSGPHAAEAFSNDHVSYLLGERYPGEIELDTSAREQCGRAFTDYVGISTEESEYTFGSFRPNVTAWNDESARRILCYAGNEDHSPLPGGSLQGVGR